MKADDDTYVTVENLKNLLSIHNFSKPLYFGFKFKAFVKHGYMSGGAGYVHSRQALKQFIENGLAKNHPSQCKEDTDSGPEDVDIGQCLEALGVDK